MPCPKCGSKHFMSGPPKEDKDKIEFRCMANGCGYEWVMHLNDQQHCRRIGD